MKEQNGKLIYNKHRSGDNYDHPEQFRRKTGIFSVTAYGFWVNGGHRTHNYPTMPKDKNENTETSPFGT